MAFQEIAPLPVGINLYTYSIDKVLGKGGFGITYLGRNLSTQEVVVIKENIPGSAAYRSKGSESFEFREDGVKTGTGSAEWARNNFIREATALAHLDHPGVVRVLETFESDVTKTQYYVMPYVGTESLGQQMQRGLKPTYEWLHYLLCFMLNTLRYVHESGVLHRDIKPDNILMQSDGQPVLIDFGSARAVKRDDKTRIVTEEYSPIEQVLGEGEGTWTDLYSLGATLYYIITKEGVPQPLMRMSHPESYVPLASRQDLVQAYGYPILASIDHALALKAEDRFREADEWIAVMGGIEAFQHTAPVPVPVAPVPQRPERVPLMPSTAETDVSEYEKEGSLAWLWALLGLLLVLLLGGGAYMYFLRSETPQAPVSDEGNKEVTTPRAPQERTRVIVRPGAKMYSLSEDRAELPDKEPTRFAVYYVTQEAGDYYLVTPKFGSAEPVGALRKTEVHVWPNNLSLKYQFGQNSGRRPSLYFDSADHAESFVKLTKDVRERTRDEVLAEAKTMTEARLSKKDSGAEPQPDTTPKMAELERNYGIVAVEPERTGGEYLMPILDYKKAADGSPYAVPFDGSNVETGIVRIAAMTSRLLDEQDKQGGNGKQNGEDNQAGEGKTDDEAKRNPGGTVEVTKIDAHPLEVVFVIDTTKSMGPYIRGVRKVIDNMVKQFGEVMDRGTDRRIYFGLVAYRDFKAAKPNGTGEDASFYTHPKGIGYHVKTFYDKDNKRLYTLDEFNEKVLKAIESETGKYVLREAEGDSIDCHEDLVAGLVEACNIPWSPSSKSLHYLILIGDAPGREDVASATCERSGREVQNLYLGSPFWKYRPKGSLSELSLEGVKTMLSLRDIPVEAFYIRPRRYKGIGEKAWNDYIAKGEDQFRRLSFEDPVTHDHVYHVMEAAQGDSDSLVGRDDLDVLDKLEQTGRMDSKIKVTKIEGEADDDGKVDDVFSAKLSASLNRMLEVNAKPSIAQGKESAVDSIFQEAYVSWLSQQQSADGAPMDMVGWTMDRCESGATVGRAGLAYPLQRCVVLSREQFDRIYQKFSAFLSRYDEAEETGDSGALDDLVGAMLGAMKDPERDYSAESTDVVDYTLLDLPYKSPLLSQIQHAGRTEGKIDMRGDNMQKVWKDVKEKMKRWETISKNESFWLLDPAPDKSKRDPNKDFIVLPIDQLP